MFLVAQEYTQDMKFILENITSSYKLIPFFVFTSCFVLSEMLIGKTKATWDWKKRNLILGT
jgi:hypothetical protein